jgi:hypothetical protein
MIRRAHQGRETEETRGTQDRTFGEGATIGRGSR